MINVELSRCTDGTLVSCTARGHSTLAAKGSDIVCAMVTAILRTSATVLADEAEDCLAVKAPEAGFLEFSLLDKDAFNKEHLVCVADFLQRGLELISEEYPEQLHLLVKTIE